MPSYNERLTVNNQKIDNITALANTLPDASEIEEKIDEQDTIIENLKSALDEKAGKGGGEPNIFVQLEEPEIKKGIWLKTNKTVEHYTYDDEVYISGEWEPDGVHTDIPYDFYRGSAAVVGTNVYLFGGTGNNTMVYKYDTLTDTYMRLTDIPYNFVEGSAAVVNTDIYLFGGSKGYTTAYKYDTLTDTYTRLANIPFEFAAMNAMPVGTNIYLISGTYYNTSYSQYVYKYNILTNTYTKLNNSPITFYRGSAAVVNTDIYLFGGGGNNLRAAYKYDTTRDEYTQLTNIPYDFYLGSATVIDTDIYLFGGSNGKTTAYKYDVLTDVYTQIANIPYDYRQGAVVNVGTNIYLFGSVDSNYYNKVQVYALQSKTYQQDNLVVVEQGKYKGTGYSIELYNNPKDIDSPKYQFVDAWYYTEQGGLETDIPTYYGDGIQWINIKNPIVEEVEE